MKKLLLIVIGISSCLLSAQDITGDWYGVLKVQSIELPLVFHVTKTDSVYAATVDSPEQKALGIPVTTTGFTSDTLTLVIQNIGASYKGVLKEKQITGTFTQMGNSFPLDLGREALKKEPLKRPQEPKSPYPYISENVAFYNEKAAIHLAGSLTLPEGDGNFPAVILISGSGAQNRDEEILGHKPFLVIADYLTRNGIAVLRYDDRGVAESKGDFATATSADFATDTEAALTYLKTRTEIDTDKIGLIGHSEGGLIAPIVAAESKEVAFIVLLAGPGVSGAEVLLEQNMLIARASGVSEESITKSKEKNKRLYDLVKQSDNTEKLKAALTQQYEVFMQESESLELPEAASQETYIKQQVNQLANPWMEYFIKYDPQPILKQITCPVLAVNGAKDLQVVPQQNLPAIQKALEEAGNTEVTVKEYPGLNHLFQESQTGSPGEYGQIEQTFSPLVLKEVTEWIKQKTD